MKNILNKKQENEKSRSEVYETIDGWFDFLESPFNSEDREETKKSIFNAVQKDRLTLDNDSEKFIYKLIKPIQKKDNSESISIIEISECSMREKKVISNTKDDYDVNVRTLQAYCKEKGNEEEIGYGFLERIKDRDTKVIQAIILSFFAQAS